MAGHFGKKDATQAKDKVMETKTDTTQDTAADPLAGAPPEMPRERSRTWLWVTLAVVGVLALVYGLGVFWFSSHFAPRTMVGGIDASWLTVDEVAARAEESMASYEDSVEGEGMSFTLTASDLGLTVDARRFAEEAFATQDAVAWPLVVARGTELQPEMAATVDEEQVRARVSEQVAAFNESAKAPTDAYVSFDEEADAYVVVPEEGGTQLDADAVAQAVSADATLLKTHTALGADDLLQPRLTSESEALAAACDKANELVDHELEIMRGDEGVYHIDKAIIRGWIDFWTDAPTDEATGDAAAEEPTDEEGAPEEEGTSEEEWSEDDWSEGEEEEPEPAPWELPNGDPGYEFTDEETGATTHVRVNRVLIRQWSFETLNDIVNGEDECWYWEVDSWETAANVKAALDEDRDGDVEVAATTTQVRPLESEGHETRGRHVDVNLDTQYARLYDSDGKTVLWRSYVVSGNPNLGRATPEGSYAIESKAQNVTLVGSDEDGDGEPDYRSFVYYWMCFLGNSYGLHDATWRWESEFGGSTYLWDGSHGCVNLPLDAAAELYDLIDVGDAVYVHY